MPPVPPPPWMVSVLRPWFEWFGPRANAAILDAPQFVTSWWRSTEDNLRVGGRHSSQHRLGLAWDAVPEPGSTVYDLQRAAWDAGLVPVIESDHVHVQATPAGFWPEWIFDQLDILT